MLKYALKCIFLICDEHGVNFFGDDYLFLNPTNLTQRSIHLHKNTAGNG